MQHLFLTPIVEWADVKTYRHGITLIRPCCRLLHNTSVNVTKMYKISRTEVVQKVPKLIWWWSRKWHRYHSGTEMDMYRNGLRRGPECDSYRTWPNPTEIVCLRISNHVLFKKRMGRPEIRGPHKSSPVLSPLLLELMFINFPSSLAPSTIGILLRPRSTLNFPHRVMFTRTVWLSHDTPAVKGHAHCWVLNWRTEEHMAAVCTLRLT